jgi:hypothetical protein
VGLRPLACWDCGLSVFCECFVLSGRGLWRRADDSSRGVLPSVACLSMIVKPRQ